MNFTEEDLAEFPDILNKSHLMKICHLSPRKAEYLLKSKRIPCVNNGKKTRCYSIHKKDLLFFMNDRLVNPQRYVFSKSEQKSGKNTSYRMMVECPMIDMDMQTIRAFYTRKLSAYKEIMLPREVGEFLGYKTTTIYRWIKKRKLHDLFAKGCHFIPKEYLLNWLCDPMFNAIDRKSQRHLELLYELTKSGKNKT